VALDRKGQVLRKVPYLPEEFERGTLSDLPYEQAFMRPDLDVTVVGLLRLTGDDLIVTFHFNESFPYGGGVARVNPEGKVVWYRRDYSNHWASRTGPDEISLVGGQIMKSIVRRQISPYHGFTIGCPEGYTKDTIEVLTLDGQLKQEIQLLDALLESPFRNHLMTAVPSFEEQGSCDPIHANFVRLVGSEIAALYQDVRPDDFLVSMRNLSSLGIVSRESGKFTHLLRGTFHYQHSAQPIAGGKILLVDNLGGEAGVEGTRYLVLDPATGRERTWFPRPETAKDLPTTTPTAGNIRVSDDGRSALVAVTYAGKAYEVSLETGAVLTVYDNLHDLRPTNVGEAEDRDRAARFKLWEASFWN
jgi:hypothetical protein